MRGLFLLLNMSWKHLLFSFIHIFLIQWDSGVKAHRELLYSHWHCLTWQIRGQWIRSVSGSDGSPSTTVIEKALLLNGCHTYNSHSAWKTFSSWRSFFLGDWTLTAKIVMCHVVWFFLSPQLCPNLENRSIKIPFDHQLNCFECLRNRNRNRLWMNEWLTDYQYQLLSTAVNLKSIFNI